MFQTNIQQRQCSWLGVKQWGEAQEKKVCYMLLYCFACVFNVALDLITTYMVAYRINAACLVMIFSILFCPFDVSVTLVGWVGR